MTKQKIRKRIATRSESLRAIDSHGAMNANEADMKSVELKDGNPDAMRCMINRDTNEVVKDSWCAPWLLCGIFG